MFNLISSDRRPDRTPRANLGRIAPTPTNLEQSAEYCPRKTKETMMANSGIVWIDVTFDCCVRLFISFAATMGITYEEINVWLFVIIGPCLLIASFCLNIFLLIRQARHPRHSLIDHSAKQSSAFFKRDNPPSLWK